MQERIEKAKVLSQLWNENEADMSEGAAFSVACEAMEVSEEEGWALLSLLGGENEKE